MIPHCAIRKLQISQEILVKPKTTALFPSGLSFVLTSNDAEEMREQSVFWSYEHQQFNRGTFHGIIFGFHTSRLQLTLSHRSVGFIARGGLPEKTTIISIPVHGADSLLYRGQLLRDCRAIALKDTEELELHTSQPSTMLTVAVCTALLEQQALACTGSTFKSLRCQEQLWIHPKQYRNRVEQLISMLRLLQCRNHACSGVEEEMVEKEILETILLGIQPPGVENKIPDRLFVAKRAERHIRRNLKNSISIGELCRTVGTSERTLYLGFKERFGVSPKAYHQMMRLNGVHNALLRNNSSRTVTDLAMDWGFYHLGRFSEQYNRMFGRLPSETNKTVHDY